MGPHYVPWRGEAHAAGVQGRRLLILGDSFHDAVGAASFPGVIAPTAPDVVFVFSRRGWDAEAARGGAGGVALDVVPEGRRVGAGAARGRAAS